MKSDSAAKLARNIKLLIEKKGLSVSQVAGKAQMNKTTLHNYCNGALPKQFAALERLARALDVPIEALFLDSQLTTISTLKRATPGDLPEGDYIISVRAVKRPHATV